MITTLGKSVIMNSTVNDIVKNIKYMVLGYGTNNPSRQDLKLGKQAVKKELKYNIDVENNRIEFSAIFTASEILGTTELGLLTENDILVARDIYKTVTSAILGNSTSTVNMYYIIHFEFGSKHSEWSTSTTAPNILYRQENNTVIGVNELNTNSGYKAVNGLTELANMNGAGYFYDVVSRNLYIKTSTADTIETISNKDIIVTTK
jgi:hypothetical protein